LHEYGAELAGGGGDAVACAAVSGGEYFGGDDERQCVCSCGYTSVRSQYMINGAALMSSKGHSKD